MHNVTLQALTVQASHSVVSSVGAQCLEGKQSAKSSRQLGKGATAHSFCALLFFHTVSHTDEEAADRMG